jgi:hypothetical protein
MWVPISINCQRSSLYVDPVFLEEIYFTSVERVMEQHDENNPDEECYEYLECDVSINGIPVAAKLKWNQKS